MEEILKLIEKSKAVRFTTNSDYREESVRYGFTMDDHPVVSRIPGRNIKLEISLIMQSNTIIDIKIDTPEITNAEALLQCLLIKEIF